MILVELIYNDGTKRQTFRHGPGVPNQTIYNNIPKGLRTYPETYLHNGKKFKKTMDHVHKSSGNITCHYRQV